MFGSIQSLRESFLQLRVSLNYNLPPIALKVLHFAREHFFAGQNMFMILFGLKELIFDRAQPWTKPLAGTKVQQAVRAFFRRIEGSEGRSLTNAQMHGIYYSSAGLCGGAASLQTYGLCDLKKGFPALSGLSDAFFGCANWNNLLYHVRCYQEANLLMGRGKEEEIAAKRIKTSAVLGIISNVNYLISISSFLFGPLNWLPIVFGGVAMLTGCIKIIYDFFFLEAS